MRVRHRGRLHEQAVGILNSDAAAACCRRVLPADPLIAARPMEILATSVLFYVALGAVLFAHPTSPALPEDFHWRDQLGVFRRSLPEVLLWPVMLWLIGRHYFGRN